MLTCEAQSGVAVEPAIVEPAPVHHHLVVIPAEIRDAEVTVAALHDGFPEKDSFALEELPKNGQAFLLDFLAIAERQAALEHLLFFQILVELVAFHGAAILLPVVEPGVDGAEVIFDRAGELQFRVHHRLHPVGIDRSDGTVDTDEGVKRCFR